MLPLNKAAKARLLGVFRTMGFDAMGRQVVREPKHWAKIAEVVSREARLRLGEEQGARCSELLLRFAPGKE